MGRGSIFTSLCFLYLKQPGDEDCEANGLYDVCVVLQQCMAAALHPQVLFLCLVLVVEVGRVVRDLLLDAGPGGVYVAAAEGDTVHQVLPLHITSKSARAGKRGKGSGSVLMILVQFGKD